MSEAKKAVLLVCEHCGESLRENSFGNHRVGGYCYAGGEINKWLKIKGESAQSAPETPQETFWWCSDCLCRVDPKHVTFEETHDVRVGGCGSPVSVEVENEPTRPVEAKEKEQIELVCNKCGRIVGAGRIIKDGNGCNISTYDGYRCDGFFEAKENTSNEFGASVAEPKPPTPPSADAVTDAKTHDLKVWPDYYQAIIEGRKFFEIRKNDRDYKVGDLLTLREYAPADAKYTGYYTTVEVSYILYGGSWGLPEDMCVMSIVKPGQVGSPAMRFEERSVGTEPTPEEWHYLPEMPKHGGQVLVSWEFKNRAIGGGPFVDQARWEKAYGWTDRDGSLNYLDIYAWQEFPKPAPHNAAKGTR